MVQISDISDDAGAHDAAEAQACPGAPPREKSDPGSAAARERGADRAGASSSLQAEPTHAESAQEQGGNSASGAAEHLQEAESRQRQAPGQREEEQSKGSGGVGDTEAEAREGNGSSSRSEGGEADQSADAVSEEMALKEAERLKEEGNRLFGQRDYSRAQEAYSAAIDASGNTPLFTQLRAACHANTAACHLHTGAYEEAVASCSAALELKPDYPKVLLRRSQAYEKLDKMEEALADAQKALQCDQSNVAAAAMVRRLQPVVDERREKMKEEMLGKLKELGNSILGNFGMSLDNFKAVKDPDTGSYSINYQN